ncbi:hypothetical protein GCM10009681_56800 [Luedemannella helvata]|uniref:Uncharacterized protein n=1 Tax=Luedemannella helvata TaxID=349315 RepID=A0ABP4XK61_9ACTN
MRRLWNLSRVWQRKRPAPPDVYRSEYTGMTGAYASDWPTGNQPRQPKDGPRWRD